MSDVIDLQGAGNAPDEEKRSDISILACYGSRVSIFACYVK